MEKGDQVPLRTQAGVPVDQLNPQLVQSIQFGLDVADTYHMLFSAGIAGLLFSVIALALVLTATPAPSW